MDLTIVNFFQSLDTTSLFNIFVIFLSEYLPYLLALGTVLLILKQKGIITKLYYLSFFVIIGILSRGILGKLLKEIFERDRPFVSLGFEPLVEASGFSFPSGHTTLLFAFSFFVYYLNKKWGIWFISLSFISAFSRVIVGVHWPSDILGGIVLAMVSFGLIYILMEESPLNREVKNGSEQPSLESP